MESALTTKGQATIPKGIRTHLHLESGDKVRWFIDADERVYILPVTSVTELKGIFKTRGKRISLAEMEEGIAKGATARHQRLLRQK